MNVFLTGGTGFIGQPLTRALLARGWHVTVLVRKLASPQAQQIAQLGAYCVVGDVTNRESLRTGMEGADIVIHNAGHYELGLDAAKKQRMSAINVLGTDNVLGLALELGLQRTIYISSVVALGDTGPSLRDETFARQTACRSHYEQTKTAAHALAMHYQERGLPLITLCPNGVMGPNDHSPFGYFLRLYINRLLPPAAWAPNRVASFVYIDDLVQGIVLAAEKGRTGHTYILAGESEDQRAMLAVWGTQAGQCKVRCWLPTWVIKLLATPLEPILRTLGLPAFISREIAEATISTNYSSAKAQRELGWSYRSARAMWLDTFAGEYALLAQRRRRGLLARLQPGRGKWNQ